LGISALPVAAFELAEQIALAELIAAGEGEFRADAHAEFFEGELRIGEQWAYSSCGFHSGCREGGPRVRNPWSQEAVAEALGRVRTRLAAGGRRIRTLGPSSQELSPLLEACRADARFALDSPLEQRRFELSV